MSITSEPFIDLADEPDFTLGDRLAKRRDDLGLSQSAAAELVQRQLTAMHRGESVDRNKLGRWESDRSIPNAYELVALAEAYSVTMKWLMELSDRIR